VVREEHLRGLLWEHRRQRAHHLAERH
jgi:hypothetical protein